MRGPEAWLSENTQYGDLVLTGGSDFVSKSIQHLTRGRYSHATITIDDGQVIEAIDYVDEAVGGLFGTTFSTLCGRHGANRISAFRPIGLDETGLRRAIVDMQSANPTFDSAGIVILGALRVGEFVHRRLGLGGSKEPDTQSPNGRDRLDRLVNLAGDGLHRVHCAELVTRLYAEAGLELVFAQPTFLHLMSDLDPTPARERAASVGHHSLAAMPRIAAFAEKARTMDPTQSDEHAELRPGQTDAPSSIWLLRQLANSAFGRRSESTPHDPADFVVPSDLAKAQPFERIGTMYLDRGKWRTL